MVDGLDLNADPRFQRREWWILRSGWLLIVLFLLAAAAGLLGPGWFSSTTVSSDDESLQVTAERLEQRFNETTMTIELAGRLAVDGEFQIDISRDLTGAMNIASITPEPDMVEVVEDAYRYTFAQHDDGADLEIKIFYSSTSPWGRSGTVTVPDGPSVEVWAFTYL